MDIYDFEINQSDGNKVYIKDFKDKILLIVNTASKCGFTYQLDKLEKLYKKYKNKGLIVMAFPCNQFGEQEPGSNEQIKEFCSINYGISFPIFSKIDVNGKNAIPLFKYLVSQKDFSGFDMHHPIGKKLDEILSEKDKNYNKNNDIKWNFTKFLIDRKGNVVKRFEPTTEISEIERCIELLI